MKRCIFLVLLILSGCKAGPDFVRPAVPEANQYSLPQTAAESAVPTDAVADTTQHIVLGESVADKWWGLFGSAALDDLIRQAIEGSPTIAQATSTLAQARELATAAGGALYPQVDATGGIGRQKYGKEFLGSFAVPPFTYFAGGLAVNYAFDNAGGIARSIEERRALLEYQRQELRAAHLALSGDVVSAVIGIAGAREQIRAIDDLLVEDRRNLQLVQASFDAGNATRVDVLVAESQLANDETLRPPASQELSVRAHALAALLGRGPGEWAPPPFDLNQLTLPATLPVSLPSELVHQRPDILAAEAELHAATADVGVATANLYPHITLTGAVGQQALTLGALFDVHNDAWSLTSGLTAPLFDGGTLRARRRAQIDAMQASAASYRATVLQSLRQVADVLEGIDHDALLFTAETHAVDAAQASLNLARESYRAGNVGVLQVLDAERLYQRARLDFVRVQTQRYLDTAQLFLALGGTEL
jgi:NodT family efflux transporter outer membrane factor (OMF) lipoprotein